MPHADRERAASTGGRRSRPEASSASTLPGGSDGSASGKPGHGQTMNAPVYSRAPGYQRHAPLAHHMRLPISLRFAYCAVLAWIVGLTLGSTRALKEAGRSASEGRPLRPDRRPRTFRDATAASCRPGHLVSELAREVLLIRGPGHPSFRSSKESSKQATTRFLLEHPAPRFTEPGVTDGGPPVGPDPALTDWRLSEYRIDILMSQN